MTPVSPPVRAGEVALVDLADMHARLVELTMLGEALFDAIEHDDVVAAVISVHRSRAVRAALANLPLQGVAPVTDEGVALLAEVRALLQRTQPIEDATLRWLRRPLGADAELLARPGGPLCVADAMLPPVWDVAIDLVVLYGCGLGAVAEALVALGQQRILVFAPEGEARYPDGVTVATDLEEVRLAVRCFDPQPPRRLATRGLAGDALGGIKPGEVIEVIHAAISQMRVNRNTLASFSRVWIGQGTANLPHVADWPSIAAVDDRFAGVPMIIVAPGPSLAGNVALLRQAKGRAIITALSHAAKALFAAGVVPDLILTVDPQDVRYHFEGCDLSQVAAVVNGVTVHPSLFELGAPRYLTVAGNSDLEDWIYAALGENARAASGGSVATTALSLALRWRCDPILVVGLDLSYSSSGDYYVGSSVDGDARVTVNARGVVEVSGWSAGADRMKQGPGPALLRERAVTLPGWHGGTVSSTYIFSIFHRWFVDIARAARATRRIVNCTEGGAYIDGMEHTPLADELARFTGAVDVAAVLEEASSGLDVGRRRELLRQRLGEMLTGTDRCVALASRCARLAAAAGRSEQAARALGRRERELIAALEPAVFLSLLAQREISAALDQAGDGRSEEAYLAASARLFEVVAATGRYVRPLLAEALGKIAAAARDPHRRPTHLVSVADGAHG